MFSTAMVRYGPMALTPAKFPLLNQSRIHRSSFFPRPNMSYSHFSLVVKCKSDKSDFWVYRVYKKNVVPFFIYSGKVVLAALVVACLKKCLGIQWPKYSQSSTVKDMTKAQASSIETYLKNKEEAADIVAKAETESSKILRVAMKKLMDAVNPTTCGHFTKLVPEEGNVLPLKKSETIPETNDEPVKEGNVLPLKKSETIPETYDEPVKEGNVLPLKESETIPETYDEPVKEGNVLPLNKSETIPETNDEPVKEGNVLPLEKSETITETNDEPVKVVDI